MVGICALERGRAKSPVLNAQCRRFAAYRLGCWVAVRLRHCVSKDNPADADSRVFEPKTTPDMNMSTTSAYRGEDKGVQPVAVCVLGTGPIPEIRYTPAVVVAAAGAASPV